MEFTEEEFERMKAINPYDRENIADEVAVDHALQLIEKYVEGELESAADEAMAHATSEALEDLNGTDCFHPNMSPEDKDAFLVATNQFAETFKAAFLENLKEQLRGCPWLEEGESWFVDALEAAREQAHQEWMDGDGDEEENDEPGPNA